MTLRIGYFIPEFPGQTHIFFWREMQALRTRDVVADVVSTRLPERKIIAHTWAAEAQKQTDYLFPPQGRAALGAAWTFLRAGPAGWWRCFATLAKSEGSLLARLKMLALVFMGAELSWLAR